jgi:hypothetical protein
MCLASAPAQSERQPQSNLSPATRRHAIQPADLPAAFPPAARYKSAASETARWHRPKFQADNKLDALACPAMARCSVAARPVRLGALAYRCQNPAAKSQAADRPAQSDASARQATAKYREDYRLGAQELRVTATHSADNKSAVLACQLHRHPTT